VETEPELAQGAPWSALLLRALVVGRVRRQSPLAEPECQGEVGSQGCLAPRVWYHA
jgi:hypothetical protein